MPDLTGVSPLSGELVARHQQLFYSYQRLVAAPPRAESLNATVLLRPTSNIFEQQSQTLDRINSIVLSLT